MKYIFRSLMVCLVGVIALSVTSCKKNSNLTTTAPTDSLKIGLIAWYPFNNSGADSTGNGNDVYYYHNTAATTNRFGKPNTAFYFDGSTSYMTVHDSQALRLSGTDYTLNMWVNLDSYNQSYGSEILVKRIAGVANGWNYGITGQLNYSLNGYPLGVSSLQFSGGSDPLALGTKKITTGAWHMLTTVYNLQKKTLTYYVDGVLDNTVNNMPSPNANITADLTIGSDSQATNPTTYFLQGKLDDIRIYGRALSVSSIQKLYTATN